MAASFAVANDDPAYQHVWQVTRAEINAHRTNYTQPGYQVPASLLTWPARTASYTGPSALAPFVDVNANGHYDPQAGDYPDVLGDIAAFFIANDAAGLKRPYTLPMGVEVQGLVFAYDSACCQLPTTIFVRYRVANHSGRHYQQFYLGHYADFDIGYYGDDYVGSDSTLNMMYAYNGDGVDEGPYGYGFNPPTQAVVALRPAMNGFTGYGNSIGGALSNPAQAIHFARLLRGELLTGVPITTGGDGSTGTGTLTRYMFSGNSCNGTGWTESAAGNLPGDRRALMSFGPYSFAPGQVRTVDLAYVTNVSCAQIPNVVSQWQSFFPGVLAAPAMQPVSTLTLYPNPASQQVRLLLSENPSQPLMVTVTDMLGRVVQKQSISTTEALVDLRGLPAGLYTVRCGAVARRLVVE